MVVTNFRDTYYSRQYITELSSINSLFQYHYGDVIYSLRLFQVGGHVIGISEKNVPIEFCVNNLSESCESDKSEEIKCFVYLLVV